MPPRGVAESLKLLSCSRMVGSSGVSGTLPHCTRPLKLGDSWQALQLRPSGIDGCPHFADNPGDCHTLAAPSLMHTSTVLFTAHQGVPACRQFFT